MAEYLTASDKAYVARVRLGIATDTYDAEGQVTEQADTAGVTREMVAYELANMVGPMEQVPPMYSAVKHQGTRLYRLARRGETVARSPRAVEVQALELLEWSPPEVEIAVQCSKGTYVRSLAHDLGMRLGCWGHLIALTRVRSGRFELEQAVSLETLEAAFARGAGAELLLPLDRALESFPATTAGPDDVRKITLGQQVRIVEDLDAELCRAYSTDGSFVAILRRQAGSLWRPHKVFAQPGRRREDHPGPEAS